MKCEHKGKRGQNGYKGQQWKALAFISDRTLVTSSRASQHRGVVQKGARRVNNGLTKTIGGFFPHTHTHTLANRGNQQTIESQSMCKIGSKSKADSGGFVGCTACTGCIPWGGGGTQGLHALWAVRKA